MRIVGQNAWPVFRGGEKAMALIMAGLQQRGHDVLLVCANAEVARHCGAYGITTAVVRLSGDIRIDRALRFARLLRRYRPDAVLLGTFRKVLPAAVGARLAGVPRVVCRVGVSRDVPASAKYRFVFRHLVDAAVVNAASMRDAFLAAAPALDAASVVAIPTGVRPPEQQRGPQVVRAELGLPADARVVGSLAYLAPLKRLDRMVDALAHLPADVHWVHAGAGPEQATLEQRARDLNVHERVHLLGMRHDVGDLLGVFDVYVVTSDREGMSNAMLEALGSGVPVVSTPVSGALDALQPFPDGSEPGLIVEAEPERIAAAIASILHTGEAHARMRAAALQRARESFSYERMIDDYEAVLAGSGTLHDGSARLDGSGARLDGSGARLDGSGARLDGSGAS
jgi:glycosyltransferase involved in cell wall biosynthesis